MTDDKFECQNCCKVMLADELDEPTDMHKRGLFLGDSLIWGICPECECMVAKVDL